MAKRTAKNSVFLDLFHNKKYLLKLYQALHPEDTDVTEADIGDVTINNIFTDQEYNDLGMNVRGRLLVMLEAQTSWTMNIIIRILLYLAHICNEHIETTKQTLVEGGSIGRKLDFIAQEMNREANTILSKSSDLEISNRAIELKTEIEKVREQIQNIE